MLPSDASLRALEQAAFMEFAGLIKAEESFFAQKSRISGSKKGTQTPTFFITA